MFVEHFLCLTDKKSHRCPVLVRTAALEPFFIVHLAPGKGIASSGKPQVGRPLITQRRESSVMCHYTCKKAGDLVRACGEQS